MPDYSQNAYFGLKKTQEISKDIDVVVYDHKFVRSSQTGDQVYYITGKEAHWITNPQILEALGGDFGTIVGLETMDGFNLRVESITPVNLEKYTEGLVKAEDPVRKVTKNLPQEFTTYKEESFVPDDNSLPKIEPEKGFTSIIIPAYFNSYPIFHTTGNCIGSIREHTDQKKTPYEIILIINGKTSITFSNLQESLCDKIIENEENKGYAYAVNQGIRAAKGEYIAIVNNDVQVFTNWLLDLQNCLQKTDLAMATPMYGKPFARAVEALELRNKYDGHDIAETFSDFVDFSCVLTRKDVFSRVGLFDERFFMYGEDLDLLRKLTKAGYVYTSTKLVNTHHIIGGTSNDLPDTASIMNQSKELLKEIWGY